MFAECGECHCPNRRRAIYVGQLIIPFGIDDGVEEHSATSVAERLWTMHDRRGRFRVFAEPLPAAEE